MAAGSVTTAGGPAAPSGLRRRRGVLIGTAVTVVALLLLSRGVTVVPDRQVAKTDLAGNPVFEAKGFVTSIWASRVLPLVHDHAADAATVLAALAQNPDAAGKRYGHRSKAEDGPWNFVVHGEGTIKTAETRLRHATLDLDVGGHDLVVQIGPVIFGTALRDALPFVSFDQVVNQIQFAQISRELNDRATAAARTGLDVAKLVPGAHVAFAGAMSGTSPPQLTAVELRPVGATP